MCDRFIKRKNAPFFRLKVQSGFYTNFSHSIHSYFVRTSIKIWSGARATECKLSLI